VNEIDEESDEGESSEKSDSQSEKNNDFEEYEFANSLFRKINSEMVKIKSNPEKLFGKFVDSDNKTISQQAFKTALKRKLSLSHSDKNNLESFFEEIDEEMRFDLLITLLNANKKGKKWPTKHSKDDSDSDDEDSSSNQGISKKAKGLLKQLRKLCLKSEQNMNKMLKQSGIRGDQINSKDLGKILKMLDQTVSKKEIADVWGIMDVENQGFIRQGDIRQALMDVKH